MAYTTHATQSSVYFNRAAEIFSSLMERRAKNRVYRQTLNELSNLTTRDLADLGIARANIKSVAYEAAYK